MKMKLIRLRSINKHVKEQNWIAVGLDFLIDVFGFGFGFGFGFAL
jgi:hypothetical protein